VTPIQTHSSSDSTSASRTLPRRRRSNSRRRSLTARLRSRPRNPNARAVRHLAARIKPASVRSPHPCAPSGSNTRPAPLEHTLSPRPARLDRTLSVHAPCGSNTPRAARPRPPRLEHTLPQTPVPHAPTPASVHSRQRPSAPSPPAATRAARIEPNSPATRLEHPLPRHTTRNTPPAATRAARIEHNPAATRLETPLPQPPALRGSNTTQRPALRGSNTTQPPALRGSNANPRHTTRTPASAPHDSKHPSRSHPRCADRTHPPPRDSNTRCRATRLETPLPQPPALRGSNAPPATRLETPLPQPPALRGSNTTQPPALRGSNTTPPPHDSNTRFRATRLETPLPPTTYFPRTGAHQSRGRASLCRAESRYATPGIRCVGAVPTHKPSSLPELARPAPARGADSLDRGSISLA
jgi:hypothetical protein